MERHGFYGGGAYFETVGAPSTSDKKYHPKGTYEVPLRPSAYHEWQDGAWVDVGAPPTFATYAEASAAMVAWINALVDEVRSQYPVAVQMNWADEEAMAAAYLAETESADQLERLTADAMAKGRTPAEHAARILENAQAFRSIAEQTRTLWLATDAALMAVEDPHEYETVLDDAKAKAAPLAEAFGLDFTS